MAKPISEGVQIERRHWIYRHTRLVRVTHWINAVCILVLLMSGLQIFNATPALYWGQHSDFANPLLEMKAVPLADDADESRGVLTVFGRPFDTTGMLGYAPGPSGANTERGFPAWATLPAAQDLGTGRRWHFFFAWIFVINGLIYLAWGLIRGHFRRDLVPSGDELRHLPTEIADHARLRFPKGDRARRYNALQKLAYLGIIVLLPILFLAGLTLSPGMNAALPLAELFGGRQSARTIHFIAATGVVLFALIHIVMVFVSGPINNIRAMFTGRYDIAVSRKIRGIHDKP